MVIRLATSCISAGPGPTAFVMGTTFSADGTLIYSSSPDRFINVSRVPSGEFVRTIGDHDGPIVDLKISDDDRFILSCSRDGTVRMWDTETGDLEQCFEGHDAGVNSAIFMDDAIASASHDRTVRVWSRDGAVRLCLQGHGGAVTDLVNLADDKLASSSRDMTVRIWDLATGETIRILGGNSWITRMRYMQAKGLLATTDEGGRVTVWDWRTGEELTHWHTNPPQPIWGFDVSVDEKVAITSGGMAPEIWDLESENSGQLESDRLAGRTVSISPDGSLAAFGSDTGAVRICDLQQHQIILDLQGHNTGVISSAVAKTTVCWQPVMTTAV
ncbi:MAG: WD40 repeat domain-containing protein [Pseudomonadales bacterium]|nr:WD40 repeat domain-containing protein [Pseudomonadales bacterium]